MSQTKAVDRILKKLGFDNLLDLLQHKLSSSELNTLLLELFRRKTQSLPAPELLKQYAANRFVQPSELDPITLKHLEIELLTLSLDHGCQPVQLSPVAPLGSCSVVGTADQNKIISGLRGTEVTADATNALALHICHEIKERRLSRSSSPLRLCTTHRHVRAQHFQKPGLLPHFHLYCMVTSGLDRGSYQFENNTLIEHLRFYREVFRTLFQADLQVKLNRVGGYTDGEGLIERVSRQVQESIPELTVTVNRTEGSNNYYKGIQFTLLVTLNEQDMNIGDGGFVDWPQHLLGNKKERMMISAIGIERLAALRPPAKS